MNPLSPLPRDQRKVDADHLQPPVSFHFVGTGLAALGIIICAGLLAGCVTQKGSSAKPFGLICAPIPATPFVKYDTALVDAIQKRWYDLLNNQEIKKHRAGKVDVYFHLNPDGTVSGLKITKNTVGDVLGHISQEAVAESAPFGPWPPDMARMIGQNYREITFTFNYN